MENVMITVTALSHVGAMDTSLTLCHDKGICSQSHRFHSQAQAAPADGTRNATRYRSSLQMNDVRSAGGHLETESAISSFRFPLYVCVFVCAQGESRPPLHCGR